MKYGRVDADADIPYTTEVHSFPNAHHGLESILDFFSEKFSLTSRETVALLGEFRLFRCLVNLLLLNQLGIIMHFVFLLFIDLQGLIR